MGSSFFGSLAVRGESRASTETVPAPAGQGATEGAYREYVTESQSAGMQSAGMQSAGMQSAGMQGRSNAATTFATDC